MCHLATRVLPNPRAASATTAADSSRAAAIFAFHRQFPGYAPTPLVDALLALRAAVRAEKRFDLSDLVRDRMADAGVEVRDTREGVEWELRS